METYLENDRKVLRAFAISLTATLCLVIGLLSVIVWNQQPRASLPSWLNFQPQVVLRASENREADPPAPRYPTASETRVTRTTPTIPADVDAELADREFNSHDIAQLSRNAAFSRFPADETKEFDGIELNSWLQLENQAVTGKLVPAAVPPPLPDGRSSAQAPLKAVPVTVLDIKSDPPNPPVLTLTEVHNPPNKTEEGKVPPLLIADTATTTDAIDGADGAIRFSGDTSGDFAGDLDPVESGVTKPVRSTPSPSVSTRKTSISSRPSPSPPSKSDLDRQSKDNTAMPEPAASASSKTNTAKAKLDVIPPAPPKVQQEGTVQVHEPSRVVPREPKLVVTRQMMALKPRLAKTLQFYYDRPLNTGDDSSWSVMHSMLGFGVNTPLAINGPKGRRTNAVGWMAWNNPCAKRRLLYLKDGYITGYEGPGFQGHPGQFLAMLAQIHVKHDYPLRVQGRVFSVRDLVQAEMHTCAVNRELTFKLIGLAHYLQSDAEWTNETGESWNLPKMLNIELSQPVNGAACGGTHRIMAISYAVRTRESRGEPLDGPYVRAEKYMRDYHRYAMSLQNRNGGFSSDWFKSRSESGNKDRQLQTTGHILEWLVYSLPGNELSDPRIVRAVDFLASLMIRHRYHDWEVGPRGHALRALSLYQQRVFKPRPAATPMARRATTVAK